MENCNVNLSGLVQYQNENQQVLETLLENYWFQYWKPDGPINQFGSQIELIISPKCNLGCKYCYLKRHSKDIFNDSIYNEELTLQNLDKFLAWFDKNNYVCDFEIFSGELLSQEIGFKVLERLYNFFEKRDEKLRCKTIIIPTNFTFILDDNLTARVATLYKQFQSIGIDLGLSASLEGKYMEENRPYVQDLDISLSTTVRDDAYYDKCFAFAKAYRCGYHPMIYSKNIQNWKKNFDWYQEQFKKYDIPWDALYLLQVRNEEWNQEQISEFMDFIRYLYAFLWEKAEHNPKILTEMLLGYENFNILGQPFAITGRGLTCGIQSSMEIRLSDLMLYPCHRTGYKDFYCAQMVDDEQEILKFKCINPELLTAIYSVHKAELPYCNGCPISSLCTGQCLGAMKESNQNLFTPIPSVCALNHSLLAASLECLLKYGAYAFIYPELQEIQRQQLNYLLKELKANDDFIHRINL